MHRQLMMLAGLLRREGIEPSLTPKLAHQNRDGWQTHAADPLCVQADEFGVA
jgi:hypothetical protein